MRLVIAEKPSVAAALAAALGVNNKKDGYMEGGGYLISWCVGHLVELAEAAAYGEQYKKWSYDSLPILPQPWQYTVFKDRQKQFKILKDLMRRSDVSEVVNACDAGREGGCAEEAWRALKPYEESIHYRRGKHLRRRKPAAPCAGQPIDTQKALEARGGWTMMQRQANGKPARNPPAPARACKGCEYRKGTTGSRAGRGTGRKLRPKSTGRSPSKRRATRKACTGKTRENPKRALPRIGRAAIP